jgi:hypothetical protein
MNDFGIIYAPWTFNFNIDLIFGIWNYNDELQIKFSFWSHWIILAKLPRELKKGETFASLLNIHGVYSCRSDTSSFSFEIHYDNLKI